MNESELAIIGMSCRFPGAENIELFWQNLRDGVESVTFFSDEELLSAGVDPVLLKKPNYVKAKGVLQDIEMFDASFYGFSPGEAEMTDPQHRLFLEEAWKAIEYAGYDTEMYEGTIGIYAGASMNTYLTNSLYPNADLSEPAVSYQIMIGNDKDFLPTRVSYKLNLRGPGVNVQTACSTSLVAVHLACQSLLHGECDMALAGCVSIKVPQNAGYLYQENMILSPDGHCRAFDAKAEGTVSGNGLGIIVLKRLADAIADGDYIHAVIKGSAVNNDGSLKVAYTAPSVDGQREVISEAQAMAGIEPETITYIETHGTGTVLGDPIEIRALSQAFREYTQKKGFCAIGSVKTNLGHLDVAAGMAGLIKTVMALKHRLLPPSLHFEYPNPEIDLKNSPFYVNTGLTEWNTHGIPRRAGVSSFGIGGTNAHIILEESPLTESSGPSRPWQLLLISAKTGSALDKGTANIADYLRQHPDIRLADVAYTLEIGRRTFSHRRILICRNIDEAVTELTALNPKKVLTNFQKSNDRPVVFMFPGQGTQYVNMGHDLYKSEPTFREQVDLCSEFLKPLIGTDLRHVLYPDKERTEEAVQQMRQTAITQPAIFVTEYALAKLLMEWGVHPQAMIGHSIGEYVAACVANVLSLEDALTILAARAQLMQRLPKGAMITVELSETELQPMLGRDLSLAAINGPSLCVASGPEKAIKALQNRLTERKAEYHPLHTSHGFHSKMMVPILDQFTEQVKKITLKPPKIPWVSTVTGTWITVAEATDHGYWARNIRDTVRFSEGVRQLVKQPAQILLEVGPGLTLGTLARQHLDRSSEHYTLSSLRHPQERQSDIKFLLMTLGRLWLTGVRVDWTGFHAHERRHRIPLPTYPFERQQYWIAPFKQGDRARRPQVRLDKNPNIVDWFYVPVWKQSVLSIAPETMKHKACWLVFLDGCGLGSELVKKLMQNGQDVITVKAGSGFTEFNDLEYTLNPRQSDDYDALFNKLGLLNKNPGIIVHLWNVTENGCTESALERLDKALDTGFYSLLFLAQTLGKQYIANKLEFTVISNNLQEVTGEEKLCPEKATLLGPVKVIPQEHPNIYCRSIDVVLPEDAGIPTNDSGQRNPVPGKLTDQLLTELTTQSSDQVVAYRGNYRWIQTFEPIRLKKPDKKISRLRKGGVYLITGGLGGIGFVLAEYLARTVKARLILTGRSALPAGDKWDEWLSAHDEQDSVSRKILKVKELEKLGAEILTGNADIANEKQMLEMIAQAEDRFGLINGVFHAAGIIGKEAFQPIGKTDKNDCERHFYPKINGLYVLEKVLQKRNPDFCLLLSSLSSVLGGLGFVAYSAANIFMDAFVYQHNKAEDNTWISVNWDRWKTEGPEQTSALRSTLTESAILPEEGSEAFHRILSAWPAPRLIVSTGDLQIRINHWVKPGTLRYTEISYPEISTAQYDKPSLPNVYVAPGSETEQTIVDIWQKILGLKQIGIHDDFFMLGGHSLIATRIISRLQEVFKVSLPIRSLFDAPTVAEMAELIETIHWTAQELKASDNGAELEEQGEI